MMSIFRSLPAIKSQDRLLRADTCNGHQVLVKGRKKITIEEVRGFLFASTIQHPESMACFNTPRVSELAAQSITTKPTLFI